MILHEIAAVMYRDFKKLTAYPLRTLWHLGWSMFIIFIIIGGIALHMKFDLNSMNAVETPQMQANPEFFAAGIIGLYIGFVGFNLGYDLINDRKGFIRLMLAAPISSYSLFFGKIFSTIATMLVFIPFMLMTFFMSFKIFSWARLFLAVMFMALAAGTFQGISAAISTFFKDAKFYIEFIGVFYFIFLILSGVLFPIDTLPAFYQYLAQLIPMTYVVDGMRAIMLNESVFGLLHNVIALAGFALVSIVGGMYFFERQSRK